MADLPKALSQDVVLYCVVQLFSKLLVGKSGNCGLFT